MLNHKHTVSSVMVVAVMAAAVMVVVVVVVMTQNVWQISQNLFSTNWKYCTFSKDVYKENQKNY